MLVPRFELRGWGVEPLQLCDPTVLSHNFCAMFIFLSSSVSSLHSSWILPHFVIGHVWPCLGPNWCALPDSLVKSTTAPTHPLGAHQPGGPRAPKHVKTALVVVLRQVMRSFFSVCHWPLKWLTNHRPSVLWRCWLGQLTHKIVSEMTYNVSSGTLNSTIPYHLSVILWAG